jgi:hypothetical protein
MNQLLVAHSGRMGRVTESKNQVQIGIIPRWYSYIPLASVRIGKSEINKRTKLYITNFYLNHRNIPTQSDHIWTNQMTILCKI